MSDRLVTVATFDDPIAASMARDFLQNQGIAVLLQDESSVATDWFLSNAIGGIKLQVDSHALERAEFLLARIHARNEAARTPEPADTHFAPANTGRTDIQQEIEDDARAEQIDQTPCNLLADRLLRATVLGLLFLPLQFYALWLLMEALGNLSEIDPGRRWKIWASIFLSIPLMGSALLLLACFMNSSR